MEGEVRLENVESEDVSENGETEDVEENVESEVILENVESEDVSENGETEDVEENVQLELVGENVEADAETEYETIQPTQSESHPAPSNRDFQDTQRDLQQGNLDVNETTLLTIDNSLSFIECVQTPMEEHGQPSSDSSEDSECQFRELPPSRNNKPRRPEVEKCMLCDKEVRKMRDHLSNKHRLTNDDKLRKFISIYQYARYSTLLSVRSLFGPFCRSCKRSKRSRDRANTREREH